MPPFTRTYAYFNHDAREYMRVHRPVWVTAQVQNTISTIWAGSDDVRAHYLGCEGQMPGPGLPTNPNPIPDRPYTAVHMKAAKEGSGLPAGAPVGVPVPAEGNSPVVPGVGAGPTLNAPTALDASTGNVDKLPYDFWPQLPWDEEPILPKKPAHNDRDEIKDVWLRTKPLRTNGDETGWHGVRFLGAGGYGAAGLWVGVNDNNVIIDAMVVKEAVIRNMRDPKHWRNRLPREIRIHQIVEERRAEDAEMCRHLVRFLGHRLLMRQARYRVYLERYEAGDLHHAMVDHFGETAAGTLPVQFIWYMVKALATACLVFENGTIDETPVEGWKPIRHLDLVLGNVFLGLKRQNWDSVKDVEVDVAGKGKGTGKRQGEHLTGPAQKKRKTGNDNGSDFEDDPFNEDWSNEDWQTLPLIPVLADFGLSFFSLGDGSCPISDNPVDHLFGSVQPRYAPEHQKQTGPPWTRLTQKTDVWGIGNIIWHLITHQHSPLGPVREDGTYTNGSHVPVSADLVVNKARHNSRSLLSGRLFRRAQAYPIEGELLNLARSCLNWNPDERPTLRQILDEADFALSFPGSKEALQNWERFGLSMSDHADEFIVGSRLERRQRYGVGEEHMNDLQQLLAQSEAQG